MPRKIPSIQLNWPLSGNLAPLSGKSWRKPCLFAKGDYKKYNI